MESIIQRNWEECFICGKRQMLETHHVFGASNRKNSTKYGLTIRLCHYCHNEPPNGIHFNKALREEIQNHAQIMFETTYPKLNFVSIFGKNYKKENTNE